MIRICKERKYYDLLMKELDKCKGGEDGMIEYEQLKGLKWLEVLIKENLRMNPVVSGMHFIIIEL